jgi:hypothetical protein
VLTDFLDLTISNDLLTAAFEQAIASQNLSSEEWLPVIEQSINFCNETGQCVSLVSKPLTQSKVGFRSLQRQTVGLRWKTLPNWTILFMPDGIKFC